jgi:ribosomal-protein-alanine N-acetyltransferase
MSIIAGGLGGTLLKHFIEQSLKRNTIEAWLEVRASNVAAVHLYEQHDFIEVVGRRREAVFKCNWKEMH